MSVQTSAIPAALAYLVTAATAAFPDAQIFDGPMVSVDQEQFTDRVTIGWDGDPEVFTPAVDGAQEFNALNRGVTKNETFSIVCSVTHWDGDDNVATARTAAFALLRTFELLMRGLAPNGAGDVTLGGAVLFAGVGGATQVLYAATDAGMACTVVFHVSCTARLTGS